MPACYIAEHIITDPAKFEEYRLTVGPMIAKHGGRYLTKGGRLLLALDPAIGDRSNAQPKLVAVAKEWGIDVGTDVVLDVSGRSNNATVAVVAPPYPSHPITDDVIGFALR